MSRSDVVDDEINRRLSAKDLGLLPRRDKNGRVLTTGPEILYEELEERLMNYEDSVFHPDTIVHEVERQVVVVRKEGEEMKEVVLGDDILALPVRESGEREWYMWLLLPFGLFIFFLLSLTRTSIRFFERRSHGRGGGAARMIGLGLWRLRCWLLRRALYRQANLGIVRKTHSKASLRRFLVEYDFSEELWERVAQASPSEYLVISDQQRFVRAISKLKELSGDLRDVTAAKRILKDYGAVNRHIDEWLDKQVVRLAVEEKVSLPVPEGFLDLTTASFDEVLNCDPESQRSSPNFRLILALHTAFKLVGKRYFSDFITRYKGEMFPCVVEAFKRHAEMLTKPVEGETEEERTLRWDEWVYLIFMGATLIGLAGALGKFMVRMNKKLKDYLTLRKISGLPSVGGGGGMPPPALELGKSVLDSLESAADFESRLAALNAGLLLMGAGELQDAGDAGKEVNEAFAEHLEPVPHILDKDFIDSEESEELSAEDEEDGDVEGREKKERMKKVRVYRTGSLFGTGVKYSPSISGTVRAPAKNGISFLRAKIRA